MRYTAHLFVLALVALPAAVAHAQTPAAQPGNPAARLLLHRAELSLSADQIRRLEEIDRRTSQQDLQLRTRLEALRGAPMGQTLRIRDMTAEQREQLAANRGEIEPLMAQLRAVHAQTIADSRAVLTVEQSDRARAILFRGPGQGIGRGPAAGLERGRGFVPGARPGFGPTRGAGWRGVNRNRSLWLNSWAPGWRGRGPGE
jgi:hypothetical protein